jgi:TRAP-type C4-dicarboxylate transport system permease large subunit
VVKAVDLEQWCGSDLFAAGLLPGLLMVVMPPPTAWRTAHPLQGSFSWREAAAAVREGAWEIPLPIVVLGGIYSGAFALSEAAAVTALYVLVVEVAIHREIPLRRLPGIMRESMVLVGAIMIILGLAARRYLIDTEVR